MVKTSGSKGLQVYLPLNTPATFDRTSWFARTIAQKLGTHPGNVGTGKRRDEQFSTICKVAVDQGKPVRIGVNGGSLNQELVVAKMQENTDRSLGRTSEEVLNECMVISAIQSTALALETGLRKDQIIISCKVSRPRDLIAIYRELARKTFEGVAKKRLERSLILDEIVRRASGDLYPLTPYPFGNQRGASAPLVSRRGVTFRSNFFDVAKEFPRRFANGLCANDFLKRSSIISYNAAALARDADDVRRMADKEGLTAHRASVDVRLP